MLMKSLRKYTAYHLWRLSDEQVPNRIFIKIARHTSARLVAMNLGSGTTKQSDSFICFSSERF